MNKATTAAPVRVRSAASLRARARCVLGIAIVVGVIVGTTLAFRDQDWSHAYVVMDLHALPYLVGAGIINLGGLFLAMLAWRVALNDLGPRVNLLNGARVYFAGLAAKYMPGKIWTLVTQIQLGDTVGIATATTIAAYVLNVAITTLTGLAIGMSLAPTILPDHRWLLLLPVVVLMICLIRPHLVLWLADAGARLLRHPLPALDHGATGVRAAIPTQLLCWIVAGTHLWLLAILLGAEPLTALPWCVGGFALGMVAGSLAAITPDGLGVREAVLMLALAPVLPFTAAALVVILSRIIALLTELLAVGSVLGMGVFHARAMKRRAHWQPSDARRST